MDETPTPSVDPASAPGPQPAPPTAAAQAHGHGLAYSLLAVFLAALVFGGWGLWTVFAPRPGDARAQLAAQAARNATAWRCTSCTWKGSRAAPGISSPRSPRT
jgi:hypothetical protein